MAVNKDTRKIKEVGEYTTSPARRKANNKFAKQNYETVGYKCKKGIKSILEIIVKNTGEKSVSKLVEKAVIEYVKNLEHGTNVLASAEEDLLLLKDILKYDNENRCLYPLDQLDYLKDLCYMYYENRKDKKDFEFSPILIHFLKPYNESKSLTFSLSVLSNISLATSTKSMPILFLHNSLAIFFNVVLTVSTATLPAFSTSLENKLSSRSISSNIAAIIAIVGSS